MMPMCIAVSAPVLGVWTSTPRNARRSCRPATSERLRPSLSTASQTITSKQPCSAARTIRWKPGRSRALLPLTAASSKRLYHLPALALGIAAADLHLVGDRLPHAGCPRSNGHRSPRGSPAAPRARAGDAGRAPWSCSWREWAAQRNQVPAVSHQNRREHRNGQHDPDDLGRTVTRPTAHRLTGCLLSQQPRQRQHRRRGRRGRRRCPPHRGHRIDGGSNFPD